MVDFKEVALPLTYKTRNRLVYGVGITEKGKYKTSVCGKQTKEYRLWADMLKRAYCEDYHRTHPTYAQTSVSENFKNFQYFAEWCNQQVGFGVKGWELDKDILSPFKIYSETTCCFVPRVVNSIVGCKRKSVRGELPLGVSYDGRANRPNRYCTSVNDGSGKAVFLGCFSNPTDAFLAYKAAKEAIILSIVEQYKDSLDDRVYQALLKYKIKEDD